MALLGYFKISEFDSTASSVDETGAKPVEIAGARPPDTRLCFVFFYLSRWHHHLSIVQINPFTPSPSHSATDSQSFRFIVKIFSRSALARGPEKNFFTGARARSRRPCLPQARDLW
jgi:hypothetical protein